MSNIPNIPVDLTSQRGVGLLEVLIAMLLLSVGVLGFAALQVKAVDATVQSGQRTQAITLIATLADKMQVNMNGTVAATAAMYQDLINTPPVNLSNNCSATPCTPQALASKDVFDVSQTASRQGMTLHMQACPTTINQWCLFVAWGNTNITATGYGTDANVSCMRPAGQSYWPAATCVMMEAF